MEAKRGKEEKYSFKIKSPSFREILTADNIGLKNESIGEYGFFVCMDWKRQVVWYYSVWYFVVQGSHADFTSRI